VAYNAEIANRVRKSLAKRRGFKELKMMGGLCFMIRGHMCCGVLNDDLVVRVGRERHGDALSHPHTRPMDFTGRALRGFVYVGPEGHRRAQDLERWLKRATDFVQTLPRKKR